MVRILNKTAIRKSKMNTFTKWNRNITSIELFLMLSSASPLLRWAFKLLSCDLILLSSISFTSLKKQSQYQTHKKTLQHSRNKLQLQEEFNKKWPFFTFDQHFPAPSVLKSVQNQHSLNSNFKKRINIFMRKDLKKKPTRGSNTWHINTREKQRDWNYTNM